MAEHKYGQPMVVGQNLNDAAEDYYVLKLGELMKKNKDFPAVTIYYRSTEYNLHSETCIDGENKVHFVVNYWGECFFFLILLATNTLQWFPGTCLVFSTLVKWT